MAGSNCEKALDRLFEYIDHELPDEELRNIGNHLRDCPPCEAERRINEKIKTMVSCCGDETAPADLRLKILGTLESARASNSEA